jgi:Protein of unknown function (DUF2934)
MSFIRQQINSFIHLGGCKEYLIMAKTRNPGSKAKKNEITIPESVPVLTESPASVAESGARIGATLAEAKKLEVVKSENRATVVPINLEQEIRRRAYELYEKRGYTGGHETEDWLLAEREVRQRYAPQTA